MVEKGDVKKAAKMGPAKEPVKDEKGKTFVIVAVVIAVIVAALIFFLVSSKGEEKVNLADILAALESIEHAKAETNLVMSMSMVEEYGLPISMGTGMEVEYDAVDEELFVRITSSAGFMEQKMDVYTIDDTTYSYVPNVEGEYIWVKQDTIEGMMDFDISESIELLGIEEGEVIGTEEVNGKQAIKVKLEPDIKGLVESYIGGLSENIDQMAISEAEINQAVDELIESIKEIDMTLWVGKDDSLPIKLEGNIVLEMDVGAALGYPGAGKMEINVDISAEADYYTPVDIQLPVEALDAIDLTALMGFGACGDGWCGFDENTSYCPQDCYCGNEWCDPGEDSLNCPTDCYCGNAWCDPEEDETSCPMDCAPICGDYWCDEGEDSSSCPADCYCGNAWCEVEEDSASCPEDCYCGNGWCDVGEDENTCPDDCITWTVEEP